MMIHRDRRSDAAGRQKTARRFAVGRRRRLRASITLDGQPARPAALSYSAAFPGQSRPPPVVSPDPNSHRSRFVLSLA